LRAHWENAKRAAAFTYAVVALASTIVVVALTFAPSCASGREQSASTRWGEITSTGKAKTPVVIGTFHGDVRLLEIQRNTVNAAFEDIERTSCGLVKLDVVWDFDPELDLVSRVVRGDNILMMTDSRTLIRWLGKKEGDGLLGLTRYSNSRWIFLVADKLDEDVLLWEWVAAHELGHAIGMDHVGVGLMEPNAPMFLVDKPVWEREDVAEFCKVWDCQPEMFFDCRFR
jgi:hypothetical protein